VNPDDTTAHPFAGRLADVLLADVAAPAFGQGGSPSPDPAALAKSGRATVERPAKEPAPGSPAEP
jgi:hypothetical protein